MIERIGYEFQKDNSCDNACTLYEPEDSEKSDRTYVKLSDNTPFFSCEYRQTGLVSAENFSDKALIEMAQATNSWIIVWDDDIKAYVTPEAVTVPDEKRDVIFEALPLNKEEKEKFSNFNICIIANRFYSLYNKYGAVRTFIKDENDYFAAYEFSIPYYGIGERLTRYNDQFEIPFAKNIEYKNILEKIKES